MAEENTQKEMDLVENNNNISKEVKRVEQEAEKDVKKEKNPKRVEQGKKLAEWNRKNNNKKTKLEPTLVEELAQDVLAYKYWILGGALAMIGVLYYTNRESVPQQEQVQKPLPKQIQVQEPLPKQIQKVPDHPSPAASDPFAMD